MGAGCIAQLTAAWAIGGSEARMGWDWIKYITLYMLWPIPLQDLRDVPGDKAVGRLTTPILMGDTICKSSPHSNLNKGVLMIPKQESIFLPGFVCLRWDSSPCAF